MMPELLYLANLVLLTWIGWTNALGETNSHHGCFTTRAVLPRYGLVDRERVDSKRAQW